MKKTLLILLLFMGLIASAQREASNWYFGDNAGISFDIDGIVSAVDDGQLATDEGCTSISDSNGDLLFYTDGRTVYNANHQIMSNGNDLNGDESSTQSAIIIPKPNDPDIYYIFTVDAASIDGIDLGFHYSEVNMTLSGGLGNVTSVKNVRLLFNTTEKLSAVLKDCDSQSIWVITFGRSDATSNAGTMPPENDNNTFYAYRVTSTGVNTNPVVSNIGLSINESRGYLKFSPDGTKLAAANIAAGLYLFDFNTTTGVVSNAAPININFSGTNGPQNPYGVEFSPDNKLLYVTTFKPTTQVDFNDSSAQYGALHQFNLEASNISGSQITIDDRITYRSGLQLGPNGKIYRAMSYTYNEGAPFLSVVDNPNQIGFGCNYQHNAIQLTSNSRQGLPPFITSFFTENIDIIQDGISTTNLNLCDGDMYILMADDITDATYTWTQDGNLLPESDFDLEINGTGFYEVLIELNDGNCGFLRGEADVSYFTNPVANQPADIRICDDDNDGVSNFDFTQQTTTVLGMQDPLDFEVKYYDNMVDANAETNSITGTFENTSSPQPIYVRAQNSGNPNCYEITFFNIYVFDSPVIENADDYVFCDQDSNAMDGFTTINLSSFNTLVIGTQNIMQFSVSYHQSLAEAESGQNALPNNYTNQTAFSETLFIRIENNDETNCYSTETFQLIINPIPEAFDTDIYQCDDVNSVDGFTTFNLTESNAVLTGNAADRIVQFYNSQNNAENDINAIDGTAYNNISNPETIYVRVINAITGCYSTTTLALETSDTQISNYTAPEVCDVLNSEDGINTFDLDAFSSEILNGLPTGLDINYFETYSDALLEQNVLTTPYNNTTPYSQTLFVRVENDNACYGINEVLLRVNTLPELETENETILYCLNNFPEMITLNSGLVNTSTSNYSFNWSSGESSESIQVNTVGTYTVVITNNTTGCNKTKTIIVEPSNIATIEGISIIDGSISNNQIIVTVSGEGDYQHALTNQDSASTPFQDSNVFSNIPPGIFSVTVRDIKNNCGSVTQLISVIGFPQYFTPNNDTVNDTWQVYGVSKQFQRNAVIHIFDRFGKLITTLDPSRIGWDGTFNGNPMPASDYWFHVTLEDGRVYKNHFTLKR